MSDWQPKYSLNEAERLLAERECAMHGHDFEHVVDAMTQEPSILVCARCRRTWNITAEDRER